MTKTLNCSGRRLSFRRLGGAIILQLVVIVLSHSFGDHRHSFVLGFSCGSVTIGRSSDATVQMPTRPDSLSRTRGSRENYNYCRVTTTAARLKSTSENNKPNALPMSLASLDGGSIQAESATLQSLLVWITAFASSHIGMSAIRQTLITDVFGRFLADDVLGVVGTGKMGEMPDFWPGDSSGTNELFPDVETAGRQFYRLFYTAISFATLGSSLSVYLALNGDYSIDGGVGGVDGENIAILASYAATTLAGAFSLASLANASPLGLVPSFRPRGGRAEAIGAASSDAGDTLLGFARDDELKFDPRGLTRISRHPLILPVVPWGIGTAVLMGGRPADAILFGGLALYAVAGCYCQDLRVLREEGSVGTTFFRSNEDDDDHGTIRTTTTNQKLKDFYNGTSFLPFGAVLDGRQPWELVIKEFPILPFTLAIPSAFAIESCLLRILGVEYNMI